MRGKPWNYTLKSEKVAFVLLWAFRLSMSIGKLPGKKHSGNVKNGVDLKF